MGSNLPVFSRELVRAEVVRIVAGLARIDAARVQGEDDLRDVIGLRSLDVLVVRETLERAFGILITDADMAACSSVAGLENLIVEKRALRNAASAATPATQQGAEQGPIGSVLRADGLLETNLEVSMPLLGQNGMSETALLMRVVDLRWQHMASIAKLLTRDIVDTEGDRLYAAVFFVEARFPSSRPLGTYIENDRISIVSTLHRFGTSMLDGVHYILPFEAGHFGRSVPASLELAEAQHVPWIRITNSFVKKWDGAAWLKKSRPVAEGFTRIRELAEPPDSHEEVQVARGSGRFFEPPETYVPLSAEPVTVPYDIVPDRDLNGAGLLYFAVYPSIMDVAERRVLSLPGPLAFDHALIDRRTLVQRKTAYLSNAAADDRLDVTLQVHIESPFRTGSASPELSPIRLLETIRVNRASDGRLIAVSGAKKIIMGTPLGETSLFDELARRK